MADLTWDHKLKGDQSDDPVVYAEMLELSGLDLPEPTDEDLLEIFKTSGYSLQTWARRKDDEGRTILTNDPHWIATRGSTPLHYDPRYPRYSHHLKLRVDPGVFLRGLGQTKLPLVRGLFYVLDAHSPHQIFCAEEPSAWNVAASIDSHDVIPAVECLPSLINFVKSRTFLPFR